MEPSGTAGLSAIEKRALLQQLLDADRGTPASATQSWMWYLHQLAQPSAAYHFPVALRIGSKFDAGVLQHALQLLFKRHSAFRAVFFERDGAVMQRVVQHDALPFRIVDAAGYDDSTLEDAVNAEAARTIDLSVGPVFRCELFQRGGDAVLLLVWHHIVLDGWSLALVLEELDSILSALSSGVVPPAGNTPAYSDFIEWQQQMLAGDVGSRHAAFWREQMSPAERLNLPTDYPRPATRGYLGESVQFTLGARVTAEVHQLATTLGATPFVILMACFHAFLYRVTGTAQIAVSFPVNGRTSAKYEKTAGLFMNQAAVVNAMNGGMSFRALIEQTRRGVLGALEHQDYHVSLVEPKVGNERHYRNPADVMFVLQKSQSFQLDVAQAVRPESALFGRDVPQLRGHLGGLPVDSFPLRDNTSRFDLELQMMELGGAFVGGLQYDTELFSRETALRFATTFERVVTSAVHDVDQVVSAVSLMDDAERHRVRIEWNATTREWPDAGGIADLFESAVTLSPQAIAAHCGDKSITFLELDSASNRIAHFLRAAGARSEQLVAHCIPRSIDALIALVGIVKAGCVYLPLDPNHPQERLEWMLQDSGTRFVLTSAETCLRFRRSTAETLCLHCDAEMIRASSDAPITRLESPLLNILYTSGSTGKPKGVRGTQRGAINRIRWQWETFPFVSGEVCAQLTSLGFVDSVCEVFAPLLHGIAITIASDEAVRDVEQLSAVLAHTRATRLTLVPSLLRVLLESDGVREQLCHVRIWSCSGETLDVQLAQKFHKLLPEGRLVNLYGCSEAAADSCYFEIPRDWPGQRVPIGKPISNTVIRIVDPFGVIVPVGVVGEIHIGGGGLAAGYLNRSDLTAERFVADRSGGGEPLYKTGDLGRYLPDGNIEYFGRSDFQVKIRGNRVELGEVEMALHEHPSITDVAVVALPDAGGGHALVAYVASRDESLANSELRAYLAPRLPGYMVPAKFVKLQALPLTISGKVDRKSLPNCNVHDRLDAYVAPRTATETEVVTLWEQALQQTNIGADDDFFERGGHSILAVQLTMRASKVFMCRVPVALLLQHPTVAGFAAEIDALRAPTMSTGPTMSVLIDEIEPRDKRHHAITIQARGTLPPLFWIPGGVGNFTALRLRPLATRLGDDQPLFSLGTRTAETLADIDSVSVRASEYVRVLREVQSSGPYYLIGFCLGGAVAYEMAQQLSESGEQVAFLAMVNTTMPANVIPGAQWLAILAQRSRYHVRLAFRSEQQSAGQYLLQRVRTLRRLARRPSPANIAATGSLTPQPSVHDAHAEITGDEALRMTAKIAGAYVPGAYKGRVHHFLSEEPQLAGVDARLDPRRAWQRVSPDIEFIEMQGAHDAMLLAPLVEVFAEQLQRRLRVAERRVD